MLVVFTALMPPIWYDIDSSIEGTIKFIGTSEGTSGLVFRSVSIHFSHPVKSRTDNAITAIVDLYKLFICIVFIVAGAG